MSARPRTLMLSPEAPYPLHGGGAFRTASLLHYLSQFSEPDLILISDSGQPALLPPGLVRSQHVIPLAHHRRDPLARYFRNASRAWRGVPPLIDRLSGLEPSIRPLLSGKRWDLAIIEHFWCAPYVDLLKEFCNEVVLDLHNVESMLHRSAATVATGLVHAGHRRFAATCQRLEAELLPRFSLVLATSGDDATRARAIAPGAKVRVYPNAYPDVFRQPPALSPIQQSGPLVVFSGNFEYHPNIDAVDFLVREVWPELCRNHPNVRLRLVGRGDAAIRHLLTPDSGIECTGPIEDAFSEIAAADVVIAPLRVGSGTRLKIVEAWAAGRAVVATPLAAEGLDARDRANIRLAPDGRGLTTAVGELLQDSASRRRLGEEGRKTFEARYSWSAAWATLDLHSQPTTGQPLSGYTGNT